MVAEEEEEGVGGAGTEEGVTGEVGVGIEEGCFAEVEGGGGGEGGEGGASTDSLELSLEGSVFAFDKLVLLSTDCSVIIFSFAS